MLGSMFEPQTNSGILKPRVQESSIMSQLPRSLLRSSQLFSLALLVHLSADPAFAQSRSTLDNLGKRNTRIGAVILDSTLTILESADAPPPIRHAVADLATDFGR